MSRPTDWHVVDLGSDPTPGDYWDVRALGTKYGEIAEVAGDVSRIVTAVQDTSGEGAWLGKAGDTFRTNLDTLPEDVKKCAKSYGIARDAMSAWATTMQDSQSKADRGLNDARVAQADLTSAQAALSTALANQQSANSDYDRMDKLSTQYKTTEPPSGVTVPTDWQMRQSANARYSAGQAVGSAQSSVASAQSALDAAKRLVMEAKGDYEDGARTVVQKIDDAKDAGVRADSWWEKIYHSDAWKVIVAVVTVIVIVGAIVLSGGAALAVMIVGGAILLSNSLMAFMSGDMSFGELVLDVLLTVIPGGKILSVLGKGLKGASNLTRTGKALFSFASKGGTRVGNSIRTVTSKVANTASRVKVRPTTASSVKSIENSAIKGVHNGADDGSQVAANYSKGKHAETVVPGEQNTTHIPAPSGKTEYRIPDRLDHATKLIGDVKNVNTQGLTSQMKDFISYAREHGYEFHLWVRGGSNPTHITKPLRDIMDSEPTFHIHFDLNIRG